MRQFCFRVFSQGPLDPESLRRSDRGEQPGIVLNEVFDQEGHRACPVYALEGWSRGLLTGREPFSGRGVLGGTLPASSRMNAGSSSFCLWMRLAAPMLCRGCEMTLGSRDQVQARCQLLVRCLTFSEGSVLPVGVREACPGHQLEVSAPPGFWARPAGTLPGLSVGVLLAFEGSVWSVPLAPGIRGPRRPWPRVLGLALLQAPSTLRDTVSYPSPVLATVAITVLVAMTFFSTRARE